MLQVFRLSGRCGSVHALSRSALPSIGAPFLTLDQRSYCSVYKLTEINQKIADQGKARDLEAVFQTYTDLIESKIKPTPKTVALVLEACAKCKETEHAFEFFYKVQKEGVELTVEIFNALLSACAATGKIERGNLLLDQMVEAGLQPDLTTFHRMIQLSFQANRVSLAEKMFTNIQKFGFEPTVVSYNLMIKGFIKQKEKAKAMELFSTMKTNNIAPNRDTYGLIVEHSDSKVSLQLLNEMKQYRVKPNVALYNAFITSCGKDGNIQRAYQIYEIMNENKVKPDRLTFNTLMASTIKAKEYDQTLRFYTKMCELGIEPNVTTYNNLIARSCRMGETDTAIDTLGEMKAKKLKPNIATYNALLSGCVMTQNSSLAHQILNEMEIEGIVPNETTEKYKAKFPVKQANLPSVQEKSGAEPGTESGAESGAESGIDSDDVENIEAFMETVDGNEELSRLRDKIEKANTERENRDMEAVNKICETLGIIDTENEIIKKPEYNIPIALEERETAVGYFCELLSFYIQHAKIDKALKVVELVHEMGERLTNDEYNHIIMGCGRTGELERLADVFEWMETDNLEIDVDTHNSLIMAYGQAGYLDDAIGMLDVMLKEGVTPNAESYEYLLRSCVLTEGDQYGKVTITTVLNKLKEANVEWDENVYNLVVAAYERIEDYEEAAKLYQSLKATGMLPNTDGIGAMFSVAAHTKNPQMLGELSADLERVEYSEEKIILQGMMASWLQS